MSTKKYRVNHEIKAPEVRVIHNQDNRLLPLKEAITLAKNYGLDLIEVSSNSKPPVCKIENYGKFLYSIEKAKKHEKNHKVKELHLHVNIGEHDYQTKIKQGKKFLEEHHPVVIRLQFRGRENVHKDMGVELLERVGKDLEEVGHTEGRPKIDGKNAFLRVSPGKTKREPNKEETNVSPKKNNEIPTSNIDKNGHHVHNVRNKTIGTLKDLPNLG